MLWKYIKFTTDKKADLAKLKKLFIDGDETAIPDAIDTVKYLKYVEIDETHEYDIIRYNNNPYKVTYKCDDVWACTNVEPITEEETILYCSVGTINGVEYYYYNDTVYKKTTNGIEKYNGVLVSHGVNKIAFIPKQNQTWYGWATDEDDTNDLDLSDLQENLTLKKLIRYVHTEDDKTISSSPVPIPINNNIGSVKAKVMLLVQAFSYLYDHGEITKSTDIIVPGHLCEFRGARVE